MSLIKEHKLIAHELLIYVAGRPNQTRTEHLMKYIHSIDNIEKIVLNGRVDHEGIMNQGIKLFQSWNCHSSENKDRNVFSHLLYLDMAHTGHLEHYWMTKVDFS